jgi:hypothetical protein
MNPDLLHITNILVSRAYAGAYAYIYYVVIALGLCSCVAAACTRDMDRYLTDKVSRQIYQKEDTMKDILEQKEQQTKVVEVEKA